MEDAPNTFDDVAGETGLAASNLAAHLGSMDSEELLALDDELRSLMAHPGWVKLAELVRLQRTQIERGAMARLWSQYAAGHTVRDQAPFIRLGGVMDGLGRPEKIIEKVLRTAKAVRRELGIDGEAT